MKKAILFLVFTVAISGSLFAQKNQDEKIQKRVDTYIETVESKITLSNEEKEKIIELKTAHTEASLKIIAKYKGKTELAEEKKQARKELNKGFNKSLVEAFGKERAKEIRTAAKKAKKAKN